MTSLPSPTIALLTVGQRRSIAHPAAAASFALFVSSLRQRYDHFIWLSPDDSRSPTAAPKLMGQGWKAALKIYRPVILMESNETMPCRQECKLRCVEHVGHDSQLNWLRQFYAVHRAYLAAREYGQARGIEYDWYIKRRPDLLHLQPLPPLEDFPRDAAHVPHGVMTRAVGDQRNNDHLLVCPSGELCERSLAVYSRTYATCDASFRMRWPWQSLISREYASGSLRLFSHAYTIVRPLATRTQPAGPECIRLACSDSPFSTGCLAKHLPSFVPRCDTAAREWGAWESSTPGAILRRLAATEDSGGGGSGGASGGGASGVSDGGGLAFLASIAPIPCRDDFAELAQTRFHLTGKAAESEYFRIRTRATAAAC